MQDNYGDETKRAAAAETGGVAIGRALDQDLETSAIALARLGRRRP